MVLKILCPVICFCFALYSFINFLGVRKACKPATRSEWLLDKFVLAANLIMLPLCLVCIVILMN